MATINRNGLNLKGRLKQDGITMYVRNGKTIIRSSTSYQPKRRTRKQFVSRQQMLHSCRLWTMLKYAGTPLFPAMPTAYNRFLSLMRRTPVVFIPKNDRIEEATFLLPDMPVSDGILPIIEQKLSEVDGTPALLTNFKKGDMRRGDKLLFYTLKQTIEYERPTLRATRREVTVNEMVETENGLALTGEEFADEMTGWALVHVSKEQCSSQGVVTRCTYYEQFTTEEAMQEAAKSYGGLTDE